MSSMFENRTFRVSFCRLSLLYLEELDVRYQYVLGMNHYCHKLNLLKGFSVFSLIDTHEAT